MSIFGESWRKLKCTYLTSFYANMVCVHFTTENSALVESGLNIDFHFAAIACWLLYFNRVGKLRKIMV